MTRRSFTRPATNPATPSDTRAAAERYRIDRLRLRHLRLLQQIDQTKSLRKAAEEIRVSQPAASLLLQEVEGVFGLPLVVRTAKGCHLTTAGSEILNRLSVALTSVERAMETSRDPDDLPRLRVGSVQLAGTAILPRALAYLEQQPGWGRIAIKEGRASELLLELAVGDLDGVIGWIDEETIGPLPLEQFSIVPLRPGRMKVIAALSHPILKRKSVDVADLAACSWIGARDGTRMHAAFVRLFVRAGLSPPVPKVECSAVHTTLNIVAHTTMLAMSPDVIVAAYEKQRLVRVVKSSLDSDSPGNVSLIFRRDSEALPILRLFQNALVASGQRGTGGTR